MAFFCPLLQALERLLLGGSHHLGVQFFSAGGASPCRSRPSRIRRDVIGFIFSVLHSWAAVAGSAALFIGNLKLRASAQSPPGDAQVVMIIADGARPDVLAR